MKLLILLLLISSVAYGQSTYYIRADSIRFQKTNGNTTFILENQSRAKTGAYLRNYWNGRTDWGYAVDSASVSGSNLILWRGGGTQNITVGISLPTNTEPYQQLADQSAITDTFNLVNSNWELGKDFTWFDFLDNDYLLGTEEWSSQNTSNLYSTVSGTADTCVKNGTYWFKPVSGGVAVSNVVAWPMKADAPFFGLEVPVVKSYNAGDDDRLTMGFLSGDPANRTTAEIIALEWSKTAGTIRTYKRKSSTDSFLDTTTITLLPPFSLGISIANQSLVLWYKYPGGQWTTISRRVLDPSTDWDFRDTTILRAFNSTFIYGVNANNATTQNFVIGKPRWGYLKGVGIANFSPATFPSSSPIEKGGNYYVLGSVAHNPGSTADLQAIITNHAAIFKINPAAATISTYAKIFTQRGSRIYGENSGSITYDSVRNKWIFLIPSWGSHIDSATVNIYKYETDEFNQGITILKNGTKVILPVGTTQYDPDLKYFNGEWNLTYTRDFGGGAIFRATSTDLTTWVNAATVAASIEGVKMYKIGGGWKIAGVVISTGTINVYDEDFNSLGTFAPPTGVTISASPSHPSILQVRGQQYTDYYWIYFDSKKFDNINFTWGNAHILKAKASQTGHDFPILKYAGISDNTDRGDFKQDISLSRIYRRSDSVFALTNNIETFQFTDSTGGGASQWTTTGSDIYYNTGNVAIGTTSADANHKLLLQTNSAAGNPYGLLINNSSTGGAGVMLRNSNVASNNSWQFFITNDATPKFKIGQDNIGDYVTVLTSTGNVGIGTVTPQFKLQVFGNGKFGNDDQGGILTLGDVTTTQSHVAMYRGTSTGAVGAGNWNNIAGYDGVNITTGNALIGSQTKRIGIDVNGVVTVANLAGTGVRLVTASAAGVLATANTLADYFGTGTYTPTLTNTANLDASTAYVFQYSWVKDPTTDLVVVTVSGRVDVDPTTTLTDTQLTITCPVNTNFTNGQEAGGTGNSPTIAAQSAGIRADTSGNTVVMQWRTTDVTNQAMFLTFTYKVTPP